MTSLRSLRILVNVKYMCSCLVIYVNIGMADINILLYLYAHSHAYTRTHNDKLVLTYSLMIIHSSFVLSKKYIYPENGLGIFVRFPFIVA